jgi:outer membrane protein insertion porin family
MKPKYLAALIFAMYSVSASAFQPFVVKDIRVEGIQRTEAGTVFSYLPVKVGDSLDDAKAAAAIKALYATGFFKDVRLETENGVLIVTLQERPSVSQIDIVGIKEFSKDQLKDGLKQTGLAEGRIFDKSLLDKAEQELKRQYYSRGKYAVDVTTTITPLERNRVAISFNVDEGEIAKIRQVNIVGNKAFKEKDLLDQFVLTTPGWMTWFSKNDQYSKQKLSADLETLRSFYLNQGYLEFSIDSTQVSITPDKKDIYITVNLTEGEKYVVSEVKLAGEFKVPETELRSLIQIKAGETFSRERLTESSKAISDRLGNDGYAFANVNAVPELDKDKHQVMFTFFIDPGRRVYVRRISVAGNTRTRDEVLRRELRQMEGGWYSGDKITRSRERLDRLGYFSDINVETPAVTGTTDQVDVNYSVTEKSTGNIMLGAGFSSTDGFIVSGSVSQSNVFGTGNQLAVQVNSGKVNKVYSLSFTDPYYTLDGLSLGYDIYQRNTDSSSLTSVGNYSSHALGGGVRAGLPINEIDTINFGLNYEKTNLGLASDSPQRYKDFVAEFGSKNQTWRGDVGWARDTRDSTLYPTKGYLQSVYGEVGLPIGDLKYYKVNYRHQWFSPLSRDFTLMLNGEIGVGGGYSGKPLPFFKNYYAGGNSSVRGFDSGTLGPKDVNGEALGGTRRIVGNAEVLFPFPGLKHDSSVRMSVFVDGGAAFGPGDVNGQYAKVDLVDLRYSTGLAVSWNSPVGPLKFSLAKPLNAKSGDKQQHFQFTLGSVF